MRGRFLFGNNAVTVLRKLAAGRIRPLGGPPECPSESSRAFLNVGLDLKAVPKADGTALQAYSAVAATKAGSTSCEMQAWRLVTISDYCFSAVARIALNVPCFEGLSPTSGENST